MKKVHFEFCEVVAGQAYSKRAWNESIAITMLVCARKEIWDLRLYMLYYFLFDRTLPIYMLSNTLIVLKCVCKKRGLLYNLHFKP